MRRAPGRAGPTWAAAAPRTAPHPFASSAAPATAGEPGSASALAADLWSVLPRAPLSPRTGQAAVWTGRLLLVWGGSANSHDSEGLSPALADGAAYDPASRTWSALPKSPLAARSGASAIWDGHEAIFWGGRRGDTAEGGYLSDGAAYNPAAGTWRALPPSPLSGSEGQDLIWSGQEVLAVVGPVPGLVPPFEAAAYDPATNSWQGLPRVPSVASLVSTGTGKGAAGKGAAGKGATVTPVGVTATWTGARLLVWAVYTATTRSSSGVRIDLVRQALSWSPGSVVWAAQPSRGQSGAVLGATATWTGREVLFTGGTSCPPDVPCPLVVEPPVPTYDPVTGQWGSLPGSPVLAGYAPVVWTGQALVAIDGAASMTGPGVAPVAPGDTVAIEPTSTPGARGAASTGSAGWQELARYPGGSLDGASAVWTGTSVVVWGSDGSGPAYGAALGPPPPA